MTRDGKILLFGAVTLGALALAAVSGVIDLGPVSIGADVELGGSDTGDCGERASRRHPNRGVDQPGLLTGRHPLYRRPKMPGITGTILSVGGWDWYLNPPSEWTVA